MSTDYWIKLYIEIIDDPKMATLPDRLWRRVIELFLLAGKYGKGGLLPNAKQLAWMLRMPPDDLELDLVQIASTGIIQQTPEGGWFVIQFETRQAPVPTAERMRKSRERTRHDQYEASPETVTNPLLNVTQINRLTDTDIATNVATDPQKKKPRGNPELFQIAKALATVTHLDFEKNKGRLFREAQAFHPGDVSQILREYGAGSIWFQEDWRGKRGEFPNPGTIRETWNKLKRVKVPEPEPNYPEVW